MHHTAPKYTRLAKRNQWQLAVKRYQRWCSDYLEPDIENQVAIFARRGSNPSIKPDYSSVNFSQLHFFATPSPAICQQYSRDRFSLLSGFLYYHFGFNSYAQTIKINTPRPFSTTGSKALKGSVGFCSQSRSGPYTWQALWWCRPPLWRNRLLQGNPSGLW